VDRGEGALRGERDRRRTPTVAQIDAAGSGKEDAPGNNFHAPPSWPSSQPLRCCFFVRPHAWSTMLRGAHPGSPARCFVCIVFFALVPYGALIWAVRQAAPTRLSLRGAIAGVIAVGLGAAAYAFNSRAIGSRSVLSAIALRLRVAHASERNLLPDSCDGDSDTCDNVLSLKYRSELESWPRGPDLVLVISG